MTVACTGVGAGTSIAIGDAYLLCRGPVCVTPSWIGEGSTEAEVERFEDAIRVAGEQLRDVRAQIPGDAPSDIEEFIDTHLLMIEDKALSSRPIQMIRREGMSAEWALQQHRDALIKVFEQMEDTYLRTRYDDLDHVVNRILGILLEQHDSQIDSLQDQIVVADDLSPADVIMMKNQGVAGFITDFGGPMSHTAILARSLGMPAVVGTHGATRCLQHGERLVLDAGSGVVLADCDNDMLRHFKERQHAAHARTLNLRQHIGKQTQTQDGTQVALLANIELTEDVALAQANGAAGIGLYRTEFLYMNRRTPPDEEEHLAAYRAVLEGMQGRPVVIRTLDLGADKQPGGASPGACNPALGLRAIRLCLKEPDLFIPQIRAILRASVFGPARLMLPMLTSTWEIDQVERIIRDAMKSLQREGIAFDPDIEIGGMIETPASALNARAFAQRLDFLSIGTNDLIQYTLAIDRIDDELNYLYDPAHPAVLRLIKGVIDAAQSVGVPIGMCGEMANDERCVPLLLGLGLRQFSMQPSALLDIRERLGQLHIDRLTQAAATVMEHIDLVDPLSLFEELCER